MESGLVKPIYSGIVDTDIVYVLCMFKDMDAHWMNDNKMVQKRQTPWPANEYVYVTAAHSKKALDLKGYRGFSIPYRHSFVGFTQNNYNMSLDLFRKMYFKSINCSPQDDWRLASILKSQAPFDCNFPPKTYFDLFHSGPLRTTANDQYVTDQICVIKNFDGFFIQKP